MSEEERDARWQEILAARADFAEADFAEEPARIPRGRSGASAREGRKSQRFNEALSGLGSWSSVERPRRRLSA